MFFVKNMISNFNFLSPIFNHDSESRAFCIENVYYSYGDLFKSIKNIKIILDGLTKNPSRIAILCENNLETYAAILACWLNGKSFVPILSKNPVERNLAILNAAHVESILSTKNDDLLVAYVEKFNVIKTYKFQDFHQAEIKVNDLDLNKEAYILFTSGSTGKPKGVPISFGNLQEFIYGFENSGFNIEKEDKCLQMFELTFDVSISSFITSLLAGACVYTVSEKTHKYIDVLRLITKYKLTKIQIVPSILKLGAPLFKRVDFSSIKSCILTGEATSITELNRFIEVAPHVKIYNFYGPTECTIYCSFLEINKDAIKSYNGLISIGKPFGKNQFLLIDSCGNQVAKGEKGELYISSPQLTSGYLDTLLNDKVFLNIEGQVYYKTGDICFQDINDDYLFCGRVDNQIQIQGYRVELGEIEFKCREMLNLNCCAFDSTNKIGFTEILLVLETEALFVKNEILKKLSKHLPVYMIPHQIYFIPVFPLTESGKTDRKKLLQIITQ